MPLVAGAQIGPYEILAPLGAGGMGEVYRARDSRLGRAVAVKVLPSQLTHDPGRRARLEREARLLASLTHPNIAAVYGLEESAATLAIAMELVEGVTLADRVAAGPLPLPEAVAVAVQVAEGLEAAHEKGIVHRDLKPANVKVTAEGRVKVLDFGLAKDLGSSSSDEIQDAASTAALSEQLSRPGEVLGTVAYMSPEQARGLAVDRRTDIWAFGCLLFELLTGQRAFRGSTDTDTLALILQREPDWAALPAETPGAVRRVLARCLRKDQRRRLRDIADARVELEDAESTPEDASPQLVRKTASATRAARSTRVWMAIAALAAVAAAWSYTRQASSQPRAVSRVSIPAPHLSIAGPECSFDLSRDGRSLVYVGERDEVRSLYLRSLDAQEPQVVPGTEGALCPFFSPDGRRIAFWGDQKLKAVRLSGGAATVLYRAPVDPMSLPLKASWSADGSILLAGVEPNGVVERLRTDGGAPERLAEADARLSEFYVYQPELLPGGEAVLFTTSSGGGGNPRVVAQSLRTRERRNLVEAAFGAHYVPTGHLLYVQSGRLMAVRFDPARLEVQGAPVAVVEGLSAWAAPWCADYAVSDDGTLAFLPSFWSGYWEASLVWVDRQGREEPLSSVRRAFAGAQLSPDGKRLATWIADAPQVHVLDIGRSVLSRVTTEGDNFWPVWSPDGRRLAFNSIRGDSPGTSLFWQPADGSTPAERLTIAPLLQQARGFTSDGTLLVFQEQAPETGYDILTVPVGKKASPRPLLKTPFNEFQPRLSPDGRYLAYVSNESGRDEVYVRPFPAMGAKWQISSEGGGEPVWGPDSHELFYRQSVNPSSRTRVMLVSIQTAPQFVAAAPRLLFEGPYAVAPVYGQAYDIAPDGRRFVMIKQDPIEPPREFNLVLDWFEELKARVAAAQVP